MKPLHTTKPNPSRGFSLIEMMIVVLIVIVVISAVLKQVDQVEQRSTAEQGKLDALQDARTFLDQMSTDARQMGFPNVHNFDTSVTPGTAPSCGAAAWQSPLMNDCRLAIGLVKISSTELLFEGDIDGSGQVSIVSYKVNGDGNCTNCLERAQVYKSSTSGLAASAYLTSDQTAVGSSYSTEIQNVQNYNSGTNPIFKAFDDTGAAVSLPQDITGSTIATIRSIQIYLDVANPAKLDPKTHQQLEANMVSRVQVVNCSMAATGLSTAGGIQLTCQ